MKKFFIEACTLSYNFLVQEDSIALLVREK